MNIHPLLVHFPIALLSLYSLFEFLRVRKLLSSESWFYIKAALLFSGGVGALAAAFTGPLGEHLFLYEHSLVSLHKDFAVLTVAIFGILALIYLAKCIDMLWGESIAQSSFGESWLAIMKFDSYFYVPWIIVTLATLGFIALLITGDLGATIVYGATNDPFTQFVNGLLLHIFKTPGL